MLYQAAAVIMVHGFCRGMIFELLTDDRMLLKYLFQQFFDIRILNSLDIAHQLVIHLIDVLFCAGNEISSCLEEGLRVSLGTFADGNRKES